ncbi:amidohydrolase [Specibacter cremeus]|uniref:amidohydrolase n=1 Tax=Specibacter cremeus TaxID=1629051 RepID=UPI000F76A60A|nr:amidohydrolase [Specibacter cremeus]
MTDDLILLADTIHTLDGATTPVQAVAVQDGLIAAVGSRDDAAAWRTAATEVIDLGSATLTPGLVDCHIHPVFGLDLTSGCELSGAQNLDDVRALLRAEADAAGPEGWVLGWGLDPNVFGTAAVHRDAIDGVLGGRPALIRLFDGHSALANASALERAGVTGPHRFNQAADVVCDAQGVPTGLLLEAAAIELVDRVLPKESADDRKARLAALLGSFSRSGLTGGHVMDLGEGSLELYRALEDDGELPLRLRCAPWCMPGGGVHDWAEVAALTHQGGRRWSVDAVKLFVDGTVDNGTAWLHRPDAYGQSTASFWPSPAEYTAAVHYFAARGIPTATHAIGDAGVAHVLDALESLPGGPGATVHRVEHIETVPDELVERFRRLGVAASMQPTHCTHYSRADHTDNWSARLGTERANHAWRCRDLRDAGVVLGLGSDWPIAPFEPLPIMADAQLRRQAGRPGQAPVGPDQALTALQALEGYTSHAARAAGLWGVAGSISVGKRADFTAFELDPLLAAPDELAGSGVVGTFVGGEVQFLRDRVG